MTKITGQDILAALETWKLNNRVVCLHSSLKSFGYVEGGVKTIVDAFLEKECTLMVPSFSYNYSVGPPADDRPVRNGMDYENYSTEREISSKIFTPATEDLSIKEMGQIPQEVLSRSGRIRGMHPINSFTALGSKAEELISTQNRINIYAPFEKLCEMDGFILLMGVGLTKMTALHYAEERAGRNLFIRWAKGPDHNPQSLSVGGCSSGFDNFSPFLEPVEKRQQVGESLWRLFPIKEAVNRAAKAMKENPDISHCSQIDCERCRDAAAGGPFYL
jgi:aminoglycoside N3'-acetyltransferase